MKESFNTFFFNVVKNQYADFNGRASRKQFWMYVLWNIVISFVVGIIAGILFGGSDGAQNPLSMLVSIALLVPSLAIGTRRLHDIGKSGWWQVVGIIPVLGWIILIYFFVQETAKSPNLASTTPTQTI